MAAFEIRNFATFLKIDSERIIIIHDSISVCRDLMHVPFIVA